MSSPMASWQRLRCDVFSVKPEGGHTVADSGHLRLRTAAVLLNCLQRQAYNLARCNDLKVDSSATKLWILNIAEKPELNIGDCWRTISEWHYEIELMCFVLYFVYSENSCDLLFFDGNDSNFLLGGYVWIWKTSGWSRPMIFSPMHYWFKIHNIWKSMVYLNLHQIVSTKEREVNEFQLIYN